MSVSLQCPPQAGGVLPQDVLLAVLVLLVVAYVILETYSEGR
ncbi:hypothetical protein [Streptomyces sp. or20]|nr:hypothetical protein [Streptomyces sp. or20]